MYSHASATFILSAAVAALWSCVHGTSASSPDPLPPTRISPSSPALVDTSFILSWRYNMEEQGDVDLFRISMTGYNAPIISDIEALSAAKQYWILVNDLTSGEQYNISVHTVAERVQSLTSLDLTVTVFPEAPIQALSGGPPTEVHAYFDMKWRFDTTTSHASAFIISAQSIDSGSTISPVIVPAGTRPQDYKQRIGPLLTGERYTVRVVTLVSDNRLISKTAYEVSVTVFPEAPIQASSGAPLTKVDTYFDVKWRFALTNKSRASAFRISVLSSDTKSSIGTVSVTAVEGLYDYALRMGPLIPGENYTFDVATLAYGDNVTSESTYRISVTVLPMLRLRSESDTINVEWSITPEVLEYHVNITRGSRQWHYGLEQVPGQTRYTYTLDEYIPGERYVVELLSKFKDGRQPEISKLTGIVPPSHPVGIISKKDSQFLIKWTKGIGRTDRVYAEVLSEDGKTLLWDRITELPTESTYYYISAVMDAGIYTVVLTAQSYGVNSSTFTHKEEIKGSVDVLVLGLGIGGGLALLLFVVVAIVIYARRRTGKSITCWQGDGNENNDPHIGKDDVRARDNSYIGIKKPTTDSNKMTHSPAYGSGKESNVCAPSAPPRPLSSKKSPYEEDDDDEPIYAIIVD